MAHPPLSKLTYASKLLHHLYNFFSDSSKISKVQKQSKQRDSKLGLLKDKYGTFHFNKVWKCKNLILFGGKKEKQLQPIACEPPSICVLFLKSVSIKYLGVIKFCLAYLTMVLRPQLDRFMRN